MSAIVVEPGDTLILAFPDPLGDEEYQRLVEQWRPVKEELGIKIAFAEGVTAIAVVKKKVEEGRA